MAYSKRKIQLLKQEAKKAQEIVRFHEMAVSHHRMKVAEAQEDFVAIAVDVMREHGFKDHRGRPLDDADLMDFKMGTWACPPRDDDDVNYLKEVLSEAEWQEHLRKTDLNPIGYCVYHTPTDSCHDFCLFCGWPSERK